jgi:DNA adenine methylase
MKRVYKELQPVHPAKPVAPYLGGKRILAKRLAERFEAIDHARYVEVFVGMGGPFFKRKVRPQKEVINDISGDVTNLFRILQRHYPQFIDTLRFQLASRAEFKRMKESNPNTLTDLERAGRFLYLQRMSFGGMGENYGINYSGGARFNLLKLEPMLQDAWERLSGVDIEQMHFADLIKRYDSRPGSLFYCDPPYFGNEDDYGKNIFSQADFTVLRDLLAGIQGRFVMSINNVPEIREMFSEFDIEEVELNYRVSGKVTPAKELIISN